jgi:hypothetical protein
MNQIQAIDVRQARKPIMVIPGTCGGCKSFELAPNQTELATVPCSNKASKFHGQAVGILGINGCTNYEKKASVPEGFNMI